MKQFDCVIIGAGNGGLSAACRLARAGKKILLLEKHNLPGGCASSFVRGRFEFDASLHEFCDWGADDNKGNSRKLIEEDYGVDFPWVRIPTAYRVIGKARSGKDFDVVMPDTVDAFIEAMELYVPGSRASMKNFFALCDEISRAVRYATASGRRISPLYMQREFPNFLRTAAYPFNTVCRALNIPEDALDILNTYWSYLGCDCDTLTFLHYCLCVYDYIRRGAYIPELTVHRLSTAVTEQIRAAGGEIWMHARACEVLFERGAICGVRTTAGDAATRYVISNVYPAAVYGSMIPAELVPERQKKLGAIRHESARFFNVYLGLNRSAEELGIKDYTIFCSESMDSVKNARAMDGFEGNDYCVFVCYNIANADFSPKGTCAVTLSGMFRGDAWDDVPVREYFRKKEAYAETLIDAFERRTGIHLKEHIEEIEIATPWTFARYLGTPKGTCYGYDNNQWDSVLARVMSLPKEQSIPHLYFGCAAGAYSNGYNMTYLSGSIAAERCLADMEAEERCSAFQNDRL